MVVLVTPREELVVACAEMVRHRREAPAVESADVVNARTVILGLGPFAVLISEPVFSTNPDEFEAAADAVKADVIVVNAEGDSHGPREKALGKAEGHVRVVGSEGGGERPSEARSDLPRCWRS